MNDLLFSIGLVKYGLITGVLLGLSFAFTSPFLILRKNSLFPHALTHILFFAVIAVAVISEHLPSLLEYPLILGLSMCFIFLISLIQRVSKIYEDSSTSIVTGIALALAFVVIAKTSSYDAQLLSYFFGSLMIISKKEVYEALGIFLLTLIFFYRFYPFWITQTVDHFVPGVDFKWSNFVFLTLVTFQIFVSIKLIGILLASTFFVFSGTLALKISPNFKTVILLTAMLNTVCVMIGCLLSILLDIPFSSIAVLTLGFFYLLGLIINSILLRSQRLS